jgi:hypothetical protein
LAKLFLDVTIIDLGRYGEARAQAMAGEQAQAFSLGRVGVRSRCWHHATFGYPEYLLDQRDLTVNVCLL